MASFKINFQTMVGNHDSGSPVYKVKVTTSLVDPEGTSPYDGFLLLIQRTERPDGPLDVFYGLAKPMDLKEIPKRRPGKNQKFYRVDTWNLAFYNERTMKEALDLMKHQVDLLAQGVVALNAQDTLRSTTHISPSF